MTFEAEQLGESGTELASLLRDLRKRAGLSGDRLAARCNMSQSKVSRIENGRTRPSLVDVEQILRALDAPPELVAEVFALARMANTEWRNLRELRRKGLGTRQAELKSLEASSTHMRYFLLSMVTGLLATPEYVRASLAHSTADTSRAVAGKLGRQAVLYDASKRFTFVLTEQAVRWPVVSPLALAEQMDRLASLSYLPNIHIGVIPVGAPTPRRAASKAYSGSGSGGRLGSRAQSVRRDRRITGKVEPVLPVMGPAHAYPRTNLDERGRHRLTLGQHDRGTCQEVCAVVLRRDAECLAEVPRTSGKPWTLDPLPSSLACQVFPLDDPACPDEDSRGDAVRPGDDVGTPVETVGPVDVQVSCGSEHDDVTGCLASVGMGSWVSRTGVRLGLRDGDAHGSLGGLAGEDAPEQPGGDLFSRMGEEVNVHADCLDMP